MRILLDHSPITGHFPEAFGESGLLFKESGPVAQLVRACA
jgi:hypothetical protein